MSLKLATLGIFTLGMVKSHAQQDALFSQYMFNMLAVNPAYAGSRDVLSMTSMYRDQWGGLEGAPKTLTLTADMPFAKETMGLGVQFLRDVIGVENKTGGYLSYAYRLKLSPKTTLALGAQGGLFNYSNLLSQVGVTTPDPVFNAANNLQNILPNVGAGLFLSNDKAYVGISVPNIIESKKSLSGASLFKRHYFGNLGFVVPLSSSLKLKPSAQVKYVPGSPLSVDGNMNMWIKDKVALGVSTRLSQINSYGNKLGDILLGMIEMQLTPQLRFGYAYDFTMNSLNQTAHTGKSRLAGFPTHEGMLRYEFGYGRNKILTPRYF